MEFQEFVSRLDGAHEMPSGTSARCPHHDDKMASLMVNVGEHGGIVIKCHAGCTADQVVKSMGLALSDLMGAPYLVATYTYTTEDGAPLYQVHRWANPKDFRGYLPEPAQRVLYNLPAVRWARDNGALLYFVEGEKDVDRLATAKVPATTNPTGAGPGKWFPHYADQLAGCHVIVVGDNDAVGRAHARVVAESLRGKAASIALMVTRHGSDVSDLLDAGYTLANGLELLGEVDDIGVHKAETVKPKKITWAWHHYIPFGKLTMIEGDPGDGKSILTIDLAARWSMGNAMPDGTNGYNGPLDVALVSAEDDPEDTLRPRLDAAGAALERVHLVTCGSSADLPFEFSSGLAALERYVLANHIKVVVFDPLMAFIGGEVDTHTDHSVRRALQPLKRLAERTGCALIVVRHLNKGGSGTKAIYRGGGSIGFVGAARAAFLVTEAADDPAVRVFACVKSNLTRKPIAQRYEISSNSDDVPFLTWRGSDSMTAQELLDGPERTSANADELASKRRARQAEIDFLMDLVAERAMTWSEIMELARVEGFTERTLVRARADAGLVKQLAAGGRGNAETVWCHPSVTPSDGEGSHFATLPPLGVPSVGTANGGKVAKWQDSGNALSPDGTTLAERDAQLDAMPLICAICRTSEAVSRYFYPYWVVRCDTHDPQLEDDDQ